MNPVKIITFNMAMGIKNSDERRSSDAKLLNKQKSFSLLIKSFVEEYKKETNATWFICVQEINRDDKEWSFTCQPTYRNQVEMMQYLLEYETNTDWYKHSTTQKKTDYKEAVAIFSNKKLSKVQRWSFDDNRVAVAVKSETDIWVVTTHPIKPESDLKGTKRYKMLDSIKKKMDTFSSKSIKILCGDFNIYDSNCNTHSDAVTPTKYKDTKDSLYKKAIQELFLEKGFARGSTKFDANDATFHSWNGTDPKSGSWGILDYIFVKPGSTSIIFPQPDILNFRIDDKYASDHKGLLMTITEKTDKTNEY